MAVVDDEKSPVAKLDEYLRQGEPHRRERAGAWQAAIGLQAVDGLKPSAYLIGAARRHIEGEISIDEVRRLVDSYYKAETDRTPDRQGVEEADKVSANIAKLLGEKTFSLSPAGYLAVHKRIFDGVFKFAGRIRDYNITKTEWVLRGDTVLYAAAAEIPATLDYDFAQEVAFVYKGLGLPQIVEHIANFISGLWQIHAFREGNTRTTAVFLIKYLRAMGYDVGNDLFAEYSWYFRNALVRANYRNYQKNIVPTFDYLERFLRNLLMGERNELKNRFLLVDFPAEWKCLSEKTGQVSEKPDKLLAKTGQAPEKTGQAPGWSAGMTARQVAVIGQLVRVIGTKQVSMNELLKAMRRTNRESFLKTCLRPAIAVGLVQPLYPDAPRDPRQKYLLTSVGLSLAAER